MEWSIAGSTQKVRNRLGLRRGDAQGSGASDPGSATRAPPEAHPQLEPEPRPENGLQLASTVIGDWQRTFRVVVLAVTFASCAAAILYVLQLRADRWGSVAAVAVYVIAMEALRRRRERQRSPEPPPQE
jgi:hypothetical protein